MPEFRVLGPLEVEVDGTVVPLGGPKQRTVLAMLVLRANEVVSTDAIVEALWGDAVPASGNAVVRTYVSRLRQALAVSSTVRLATRPPGYVLEIDPDCVDARRFARLVREAREAAGSGDPAVASARLDAALDLWRGDVLADLAGVDALRSEITRLDEMRLAATEDRIGVELALGHHAEVVGDLEALTAEHPFRERLWGQLVVAQYRCGRQADALAAYQAVRSALVDQLGVEPGPELRALEQDVLHQAETLRWRGPSEQPPAGRPDRRGPEHSDRPDGPGGARSAGRVPLPQALAQAPPGGRMVGRAAERAALMQAFDAARAGRFRSVFVAGPPGIGKTALAGWLAREARSQGATVVLGRADEGADVPFQPLGEAIRHWASHAPPGDLELLDEADARLLARVVPLLGERRRSGSPPGREPPTGRQADRQRLFEAIGRWVEALAAHEPAVPAVPAVVVIEDLHWADPATLLAVRHLLRHPPLAGALLLLTHRDTERGCHPELAELLASVPGEDTAHRLGPTGLLDRDVVEMIGTGDVGPDGQTFAAQLNHMAGGSPLFIHEMLQHLTEHGAIDPAAGRWPHDDKPLESFGVPSAVTDVIAQRLDRLPGPTATVLRAAAVLGEHFDLPVLSRTVEMPAIAAIEALEPALTAGLITRDGPHPERFAFSHSLMRHAIVDGLPLSQQARTHWRAGEAIASLSTGNPEPRLGEIARHLAAGVRAGEARLAVQANIRAGRQALATLAFEDARTRFVTAIELARTTVPADPQATYDAWFGLGETGSALADVDGARDGFLQAIGIAREQRWPEHLATATIGMAAHQAVGGKVDAQGIDGSSSVAAHPDPADLVDEALEGLDDATSLNRCLLLAIKAIGAVDQRSQARSHATRAAEVAEALDDPTAWAAALMARCSTLLGTPHHQELAETAERALSFGAAREIGMLLHGWVVPLLAVAALQRGDRVGFASVRRRLATDPQVAGSPHMAAYLRTWDAALALCDGRFDDAEHLSSTIPLAADWSFWQLVLNYQSGAIARERGHHVDTRQGDEQILPSMPEPLASQMRALLAALHAEAGDHARAVAHAERLRHDVDLDQLNWSAVFILRHLAEVAVHLGDPGLAAELLPLLSGYSGQLLVAFAGMSVDAAADRVIGQLLMTVGRLDEAIERFTAARALEESFGAHPLAARTSYWHARARLDRGDPGDHDAARQLIDEASAGARRLGMTRLAQDAEALRRRL